jgi:hypothetical protein
MTLVVAISRADDYAPMTCDSSSFAGDSYEAGETWRSVSDVVEPDKVVQLTPCVMVATIGDHAIGWEFKKTLLEHVDASDGFDECSELARAVVAELERDDAGRADAIYDLAGRSWRRGSLADKHAFSFLLTGFDSDGRTGMLYGAGTTLSDVPETDGARIAISRPFGIDRDDLTPHFVVEDPSLAGAFGQAFAVHHFLGSKYEDRVTRDVNCTLLVHGDPPVSTAFVLDRNDVFAAKMVYETLRRRSTSAKETHAYQNR